MTSPAAAPLLIQPCAGLANRLRALASAMCVAEDLGRPLEIVWTEDPGIFQAPFQRLFDVASLPPGVSLNTTWRLTPPRMLPKMCLSPADWDMIAAEAARKPQEPLFLKSYGHFYQKDPTRWLHHLQSLKPHPVIAARATALLSRAMGKPLVGVHIRRTDNQRSIQESPTLAFVARMRDLTPDTMFYIASDDDRERARMAGEFPGRVLMGARALNRSSVEGGEDALLDFLALGACEFLYGSAGSSFSEIAAAYGEKALYVIRS